MGFPWDGKLFVFSIPHSDFPIAYLLILTPVRFCVYNPKFVSRESVIELFMRVPLGDMKMGDMKNKTRLFREVGKYAALGLEMALSVVIGLAIGAFLDKRLNTGPWLTILFLILGFAAGVRSLIRAALTSQREMNKEEKADREE